MPKIRGKESKHRKSKGGIKKLLVNLMVSLITLLILIVLLEVFFRVYMGHNLRYDYKGDLWLLRPDQVGFTYPNSKEATINSDGFRGPRVNSSKPSILFLGDSFTFGYAIGDNDTLTMNLYREFMKKGLNYNIINGGVPGYGAAQMIAVYNEKYSKYKPKIVVVCFIEGDIFRQSSDEDPTYTKKMFARRIIRSSSLVAFLKPRLEVFRQLIVGTDKYREMNYEEFLSKDIERLKVFEASLAQQGIKLVVFPWVYKGNQTGFYERLAKDFEPLPNYFEYVYGNYSGEKSKLYAEDGHPSEIFTSRLASKMAGDLIQKI